MQLVSHPFMYPAFLATFISVIALSRIAYLEHDRTRPLTLSELAATKDPLLQHFKIILLICGTLFAVTIYGYIVPRIDNVLLCAIAWSIMYVSETLVALFPARNSTFRLHMLSGYVLAFGTLALVTIFWQSLGGAASNIELLILIILVALATTARMDRARFMFYELSFIFLMHVSILVAALALR